MNSLEIVEIMYEAKHAEYGVIVECTPSVDVVRQKFYAVRRDYPDLNNLSFVQSPTASNEMWIINAPEKNNASEG